MRRTKLPPFFAMLALMTMLSMVSTAFLFLALKPDFLMLPIYQMNEKIDSRFFLQMMDQEIPGDLVADDHAGERSLIEKILGVDFNQPFTVLSSEIPGWAPMIRKVPALSPDETGEEAHHEETEPSPEVWAKIKSDEVLPAELPDISPRLRNGSPVVFIYHTHNRESWLSEVQGAKTAHDAFHGTKNITLVGKHFGEELQRRGIPVVVDTTDHTGLLKKKEQGYHLSYALSLETVKTAMAQVPQIDYVVDFHRDSIGRSKTTVAINGQEYAQVMFVIGNRNPNWKENYAFAEKIKAILDKKYPGLCRPILSPEGKGKNGEYNQSVSRHALTIEIGGVGNTLEESLRTAKLLAEAFAEVYFDAVPVQAKPGGANR